MKVGDYVRTEYGISKIIGIYPERIMIFIETDNGLGDCSSFQNGKLRKGILILEEDYRIFIENNVKENIIDLIEVGDLVKYNPIMNGYIKKQTFCKMIKDIKDLLYFKYQIEHRKANFVSILTKEQFESMEYKIESKMN